MSHLVPESRVNKNGVPVIKHVRANQPSKSSSILSRILPIISPSHRAAAEKEQAAQQERASEIMRSLRAKMEAEQDDDDRAEAARIQNEPDPKVRRDLQLTSARRTRNLVIGEGDIARTLGKISSYSLDTLERVAEVTDEKVDLTSFLKSAPSDESNFRAFVNFRNCKFASAHVNMIIDNVRDSTGVDDLAEIDVSSEPHAFVSSVIKVASDSQNRRTAAHYARERESGARYSARMNRGRPSEWYEKQKTQAKMTRDLAAVIGDYPDRVNDIIYYMSDRDLIPEAVDIEHLRMHLDNAASSLSSGVL